MEVIRRFFDLAAGQPSVAQVAEMATKGLPKQLVREWERRVGEDLERQPFTPAEWTRLSEDPRAGARAEIEERPVLAYGATLLTAAVSSRFVLLAQLGDGDIVTVGVDGRAARPVPGDERLIANETTSLCLPEAAADMRLVLAEVSPDEPRIIMVSTDGWANAFRDEGAFLKAGPDLLERLKEHGEAWVRDQLESWLVDASSEGSGDDVSLGLVFRMDEWGATGGIAGPSEATRTGREAAARFDDLPAASEPPGEGSGRPTARDEPGPGRSSYPRWMWAIPFVALLVGALAGALAFRVTRAASSAWVLGRPGTLVRVGGATPTLLQLGQLESAEVTGVTEGGGFVWVATREGFVYKIAPTSRPSIKQRVTLPTQLAGVAFADGHVLVVSADGRQLFRMDPSNLKVTSVTILPASPTGPTSSPSPAPSAPSPTASPTPTSQPTG
jgi:prepilin-type processing-associated H-X9-DG protein